MRESQAMHEEDFWSSWLRGDEKIKEESKAEAEGKGEEKGEKRKRGGEKENETEKVRRRCEGFVSVEAFEILVKGEIWRVVEMFLGNTSWRSLRTCLTVSLLLVSWCVRCLVGVV